MRSVRDIASVPNKRAAQFYDVFVFAPCFAHWQFPSTNIYVLYIRTWYREKTINTLRLIHGYGSGRHSAWRNWRISRTSSKTDIYSIFFLISDMIIFWNKHYCLHRVVEHFIYIYRYMCITSYAWYNITLTSIKIEICLQTREWWKMRKEHTRKLMLDSDIKRGG